MASAAVAAEQRLSGFKSLARMLVVSIVAFQVGDPGAVGDPVTVLVAAWLAFAVMLLLVPPPMPAMLRILPWVDACCVLSAYYLAGAPWQLDPVLFLPVVISAGHSEPDDTLPIAIALAAGACLLVIVDEGSLSLARGGALTLSFLVAGSGLPLLARRQRRSLLLEPAEDHALRPDQGVAPLLEKMIPTFRDGFSAHIVMVAVRMPDDKVRTFVSESGNRVDEVTDAGGAVGEALFRIPAGGVTTLRGGRTRAMLGKATASGTAAEAVEALAEFIDCKQLLCAAQGDGDGAMRIVLGRRLRPFDRREANWLASTVLHVADTLRYACLIEHLGDEVARMERQRLSRDLHDSAIQPYIGLKFAIEALARKLDAGDPLADDVRRLLSMIQGELDSLRGRMRGLRESEGAKLLAPKIKRQVGRLSQLYGLDVSLDLDENVQADSEFAGEVLHLVSESLSNVRRHTDSTRAAIRMRGEDEWLCIEVRDEGRSAGTRDASFEPRSLSERASALGGYTSVRLEPGGATVTIRIPLAGQLEKA
ncbi:MAG: hypothetical protein KDH15_06955 [Rhodocyclaceae bacterium]|nr:hypothetical protein [Rhodocyclaceae bacterium]